MAGGSEEVYKMTNKVNAVREEYKRYKKRIPLPDFSDVIDFENTQTFRGRVRAVSLDEEVESPEYLCSLNCLNSGLSNPREWQVFEVLLCPGFFFIVNPFRRGVQHYFVQRSLKDFPSKSNITNLDAHETLLRPEGQSIWETSRNRCQEIQKKYSESLMKKKEVKRVCFPFTLLIDLSEINFRPPLEVDWLRSI